MMSILLDWYPGDRALEFVLIVAVGVAFLSGVAWIVSYRLARQPATRHLVLSSALFGCLAMPILAAALSACGCAFISIPLLPPESFRVEPDSTRVVPPTGSAFHPLARDPLEAASDGRGEPVAVSRSSETTTPAEQPQVTTSVLATTATAMPPQSTQEPQQASSAAGWPVRFREIATLVQIVWGCGSLLLIVRFACGCWLVHRLRRSSRLLHEASVCQLRDDISRVLGIRRHPQVQASSRVTTPVAVGLLRPIVILPERLIGEIRDEQDARHPRARTGPRAPTRHAVRACAGTG